MAGCTYPSASGDGWGAGGLRSRGEGREKRCPDFRRPKHRHAERESRCWFYREEKRSDPVPNRPRLGSESMAFMFDRQVVNVQTTTRVNPGSVEAFDGN